jgi:cytochrome c biogenesis protein CcmG, thiol:disulfide interchange protein DsbE
MPGPSGDLMHLHKSGSAQSGVRSAVLSFLLPALAGTLLLPAAGGAYAQESAAPAPKKALSSAPDFTGTGIDGKSYHLQEILKKGPVLLDFWATYCKPCMMELPEMEKLAEKYKDRGFNLITVAGDDQRTIAKLKPLVQSKGFKFVTLTDTDKKINNMYNVRNYPTSVLIDSGGKIVIQTQGYSHGDEKEMEKRILELLPPVEKTEKTDGNPQGGSSGQKNGEQTGEKP